MMITIEEARHAVGAKVVYRAPHVPDDQPGEEGVITTTSGRWVFVRYGRDAGAQATPPECLQFVNPRR
jgi:hypothetical protein